MVREALSFNRAQNRKRKWKLKHLITFREILELHQRYGDIAHITFRHRPHYLIHETEFIDQATGPHDFCFQRIPAPTQSGDLGTGSLFRLTGPTHRRMRRGILSFLSQIPRERQRSVSFREVEQLLDTWEAAETRDVCGEFEPVFIRIMVELVLGKFHGICTRWWTEFQKLPALSPNSMMDWIHRSRFQSVKSHLLENVRETVSDLKMDSEVSEALPPTMLVMMRAGLHGLTVTFGWMCYLLAKDRLRQEKLIRSLEAGETDYLENVITETLRLFPPVWVVERLCVKDFLYRGRCITQGTHVIWSPYILQRNPRYFFQPDQFLPERWESIPRTTEGYHPFGSGNQRCPGEPIVYEVLKSAMTTLVKRYRFSYAGASCPQMDPDGRFLLPVGGMPILLSKRE